MLRAVCQCTNRARRKGGVSDETISLGEAFVDWSNFLEIFTKARDKMVLIPPRISGDVEGERMGRRMEKARSVKGSKPSA